MQYIIIHKNVNDLFVLRSFKLLTACLLPMKKTNFSLLLLLFSVTSLCKSQSDDYNYDNYNYDQYNYDQNNYDEYDYNEKYDYYGHQNLLAPTPLPIQPPSQPGNYIFVC